MASYDDTATVSGSVVSIENGADDVPVKSLVVTIPPMLSGVSEVTETQIPSRNMASMSDTDFTLNSVHYYTENGVLYIDGTSTSETSSNNNAFKVLDFWLPSGTYYFSRGATLTSLNVPAYLKKYDDKSQIVVNTGSFTLSEKTHLYIGLYVYQKTFSNIKAEICINLGSTAITYEDTAPMTQYTANLGRTIYGGQADIVNGEGKAWGRIDLGSLTWTKVTSGQTPYFASSALNPSYRYVNNNPNALVEGYTQASIGGSGTANGFFITDGSSVRIRDDNYTSGTANEFKEAMSGKYVVYELSTPIDFTFTCQEVPTRLGYNAFWSDEGDTELTYYKDGYGFTSVTVNKLQGKNLASELLEWNATNRIISPVFLKAGTYTVSFTRSTTPSAIYIRKGDTIVLSGNAYAYKYNSNSFTFNADVDGYYYVQIYRSASSTTWEDAPITNPQLEMGSVQTEYEPYVAPISKKAKFHRIVYGGQADVVKGTCEPKNLISPPEYTANTPSLCLDLGEDKTFDSVTLSFLATNTVVNSNVAAIVDYRKNDGTHQYRTLANFKNEGGVTFAKQTPNSGRFRNSYISVSGITFRYVYIYYEYNTYSYISTDSMSEWQLELGSTASEYVPHFEPFSFPPISMETDEGENTLFANEGDSAITYRKAVD